MQYVFFSAIINDEYKGNQNIQLYKITIVILRICNIGGDVSDCDKNATILPWPRTEGGRLCR